MAKHRPIPAPIAPSETSPIDGAPPALPLQTNSPDPAPTTKPKHTQEAKRKPGRPKGSKNGVRKPRPSRAMAINTRKAAETFDPSQLKPKQGMRGSDGKTYVLTIRQERFCLEYIKTDNRSEAYRRAYNCQNTKPKNINQSASMLLRNPNVLRRINELKAELAAKTTLSRAWVLQHLMDHAQVCLGKRRVKISKASKDGDVHEVEITALDQSAANRALELLGKEAGMFVDRREVGGPGDFARMGDEELLRFIRDQQREIESRTIDLVPEDTKAA